MSINHYHHYYSSPPIPPHYDIMQHQQQVLCTPSVPSETDQVSKMGLFEKALTPSDVGKLNRLVIPKQHAERYFPLNGGGGVGGGVVSEKGLLLSFEDDEDKTWRFRYSYWNSSQSYVLTKGWSRFVKDKKLQAGDIVVFFRHRLDHARLFIGWRRRAAQPAAAPEEEQQPSSRRSKDVFCYPSHHEQSSSDQLNQRHSTSHTQTAGSGVDDNQAAVASGGNCRKLRLFGVNLECQLADESEPNDSPMFYHQEQYYYQQQQQHLYSNYYTHMDSNISGGEDVYRQR